MSMAEEFNKLIIRKNKAEIIVNNINDFNKGRVQGFGTMVRNYKWQDVINDIEIEEQPKEEQRISIINIIGWAIIAVILIPLFTYVLTVAIPENNIRERAINSLCHSSLRFEDVPECGGTPEIQKQFDKELKLSIETIKDDDVRWRRP